MANWLEENKYLVLKAFSDSVNADMSGGWRGIIEEGDLDFVIYDDGGGIKIFIADETMSLPLDSIGIEGGTSKTDFIEALEAAELIIGYDVAKFDLPLIEHFLEVKIDTLTKDLLSDCIEATEKHYVSKTERIPLETLYKANKGWRKHINFRPQYLTTLYSRIRDWRRGGTRSVLRSVKFDVFLITETAQSIYQKNQITFPDKETGKSISIPHKF